MFFLWLEAGTKYNAAKGTADPPTSAILKLLFPYLLAANLNNIVEAPTSAQISCKTELKSADLHNTFISQPKAIVPTATIPIDLTLNPRVLEQMNAKLAQLDSNGIMADSSKSLQSKHKFETRLHSMFQDLIITASKRLDDDEDVYLTTTSRSFFE